MGGAIPGIGSGSSSGGGKQNPLQKVGQLVQELNPMNLLQQLSGAGTGSSTSGS